VSASPPSADVGGTRSAALFATLGRIVFRYRDALVPLLLVALLIVARPLAPFGSERLDHALDVLGFLIAAAGQALRITVIGFAYIQRGGANKQLSAPKLVCEGFYAHCRNPMYVGDFLLFLGLAVIYNSPLVYCVALPIVATVLVAMVSAEETFLRGRFGAEYEAYCRRVNRFIPRLRGLRDTTRDMRFDWRREGLVCEIDFPA